MFRSLVVFCIVCLGTWTSIAQIKGLEAKLNIPAQKTFDATIIKVAESFKGVPYVGQTLEKPKESLVCNLQQLDCYTFVENVLAISLSIQSQKNTEQEYKATLQKLRYRNGKIEGYASRLHYFTEWAYQAGQNQYINDLSPKLGLKLDKKLNFMGTHRQFYAAFKEDNWVWSQIQKMEKNLENRVYYHVPTAQVKLIESSIKSGDILAFSSKVDGLDVNHEGFAFWENGTLKLLHASLDKKKVILSSESLYDYIKKVPKHAGIMVYRPLSPVP
jgi:hypothetical protein